MQFSPLAQQQCQHYEQTIHKHLSQLITQILQYDPRPSYKRNQDNDTHIYAMKLHNLF